jgi:hypothetical protein
MKKLLRYLSEQASRNRFRISGQELLKNSIIAIDGPNRKLMIVSSQKNSLDTSVINLDELEQCKVQKLYGAIKVGELRKHTLEHYLEKIVLHLKMKNGEHTEAVFFSRYHNHFSEGKELEQKAKYWEIFLSKMQKPSIQQVKEPVPE